MARNIVPPDGVNNLTVGTKVKRWLKGFFAGLDVANGANAPVNTLQRSTTYAVGDVVQSDAVHAKYYLKCTTAGTTGSTDLDFTGVGSGDTITDGTAVWTVMEFASTEYADDAVDEVAATIDAKCAQAVADALLAAHPVGSFYESTDSTSPATLFGGTWQEQIPDGELIGTVAAFANDTLPDGWLACDGTAVSRNTYANLFSKIGTTYGVGDGSDTFNLPDLTDKFIQGNGTVGTVKSAGLPNITGSLNAPAVSMFRLPNGAFGLGSTYNVLPSSYSASAGDASYQFNFDASRSNSIYGNSTTVQPPALTMRFAIFAGHSALFRWIRQS